MDNCPECNSSRTIPVGDEMFKCVDCGLYFSDSEDLNSEWEPSARKRTRPKLDWDDATRKHPPKHTWEDDA